MLQSMNGVLVLLSDQGELQCCYLGTEPSLFMAPPLESHAIDYEQAGKELSELQKVIKMYTKRSGMYLHINRCEQKPLYQLSNRPTDQPTNQLHRMESF